MNTAYLLMSVSKKLRYELNIALNTTDITAQQFSVLQHIHTLSKNQEVNASILSHCLDMDKPTTSGIISRLEKKNLLKRETHPKDKRASIILLTPTGKEKLKACIVIADDVLLNFLTPLTEIENKTLFDILTKLNLERI